MDAAAPASPATVTYREFIAQHLSPRVLAAQIIERSRARDGGAEKIDAVYLSPDAFARRTDEASIAEQIGDILHSAGLPRPVPADNDRIGGWMLMYQMLDAGEWLIADSCPELIRTLPELVRDTVNVEDIAKRDGDDAADAAPFKRAKQSWNCRRGTARFWRRGPAGAATGNCYCEYSKAEYPLR